MHSVHPDTRGFWQIIGVRRGVHDEKATKIGDDRGKRERYSRRAPVRAGTARHGTAAGETSPACRQVKTRPVESRAIYGRRTRFLYMVFAGGHSTRPYYFSCPSTHGVAGNIMALEKSTRSVEGSRTGMRLLRVKFSAIRTLPPLAASCTFAGSSSGRAARNEDRPY